MGLTKEEKQMKQQVAALMEEVKDKELVNKNPAEMTDEEYRIHTLKSIMHLKEQGIKISDKQVLKSIEKRMRPEVSESSQLSKVSK